MYALKCTLEDGQEKFICHAHKTEIFFVAVITEAVESNKTLVDYLKNKTIVIISPPVESDDDI